MSTQPNAKNEMEPVYVPCTLRPYTAPHLKMFSFDTLLDILIDEVCAFQSTFRHDRERNDWLIDNMIHLIHGAHYGLKFDAPEIGEKSELDALPTKSIDITTNEEK